MRTYPQKLLPQPKYKSIDCNLGKYHLVRHFDTKGKNDAIEDTTKIIKSKYICSPRENMIDLSTNLVGRFKLKYLKIELTDKGKVEFNSYCECDMEGINLPKYNDDYVLNTKRDRWFLHIKDISNHEVDYHIGDEHYKAICKIVHTPMKWNYWHFSIKWFLHDGKYWDELDSNGKKGWEQRLAFLSRSHLRKLAFIEKPNFKIIKAKHFKK